MLKRVTFKVNIVLATFATTFDLQDRWISDAPATGAKTVVTKPDTSTTAALSWKTDSKYNSKTGCGIGIFATETTPATYWCKSLNVHFSKNWVVINPANQKDQDIQLTA